MFNLAQSNPIQSTPLISVYATAFCLMKI